MQAIFSVLMWLFKLQFVRKYCQKYHIFITFHHQLSIFLCDYSNHNFLKVSAQILHFTNFLSRILGVFIDQSNHNFLKYQHKYYIQLIFNGNLFYRLHIWTSQINCYIEMKDMRWYKILHFIEKSSLLGCYLLNYF